MEHFKLAEKIKKYKYLKKKKLFSCDLQTIHYLRRKLTFKIIPYQPKLYL